MIRESEHPVLANSLCQASLPTVSWIGLSEEDSLELELGLRRGGFSLAPEDPLQADVCIATWPAWQNLALAKQAETQLPALLLVLDHGLRQMPELPLAAEYLESPLHLAVVEHRLRTLWQLREGGRLPATDLPGGAVTILAGWPALEAQVASQLVGASEKSTATLLLLEFASEGQSFHVVQAANTIVFNAIGRLQREWLQDKRGECMRAARLQNSQYAIFFVDCEGAEAAQLFAQRWHDLVSNAFREEWKENAPSVHLGYVCAATSDLDVRALRERAEIAIYCVGQRPQERVQAYSESMLHWARDRRMLVDGLRTAIEKNQFVVYYQPRVDAQSRRVLGFEALVRWNHPELGLVPPLRFIPLAEENGLIIPLGEWVLGEACRQAVAWQREGLAPVRMSVNLSAVQFRQPDLFERVSTLLAQSGLPPKWLELELTESMLMHNPRTTIATLERFKAAGVHLSIDDFGTGYSSLSYLRRFPIDALKIDRSFVKEITANADDAAIATAIILMGHSLKLSIVAEGVETESQLSFLQILQCNEIQGYLISPPVPADRARKFLTPAV